MRKMILEIFVVVMMLGVAVLALALASNAAGWQAGWQITEIIDATGDGGGNTLG